MTAIETAPEVQAAESVKTPALLGPWALMWRQFRRHKIAYFSLFVVGFVYFVALVGEFLAPANYLETNTRAPFAPPQGVHFFTEDADGGRRLIPTDRHFFGPKNPRDKVYFFGADRLGRDILSRIIMGTRISMSIGLVGVAVSLIVGVSLGGLSGYYGGWIDNAIQRLIEFLRSIPTIPLWMGLAAAIPLDWPPLRTYFVVTLIVSMIGWTTLAREVRGKFLSLRHEDFVIAARLDGLSDWEVIRKHLVPSFSSHIIASLTLAVPLMILAETSLSFLGIGLQPPIVSWGTLLKEAQNIRTIIEAPWLLIAPGAVIVITVLALNFLGDGLRDAADPYAQ